MENKINCEVYILSLFLEERKHIIEHNVNTFPFIKTVKCVNGFDINETFDEFKKIDIKYNNIEHKQYGAIANWITKFKILNYQIENNIDYICFLEDDVLLKDTFINFINESINKFLKDDVNMLRLLEWGEGYITSLNGAKRIVEFLKKNGIILNIDNQLRLNCGKEIKLVDSKKHVYLCVETNEGYRKRTQAFKDHPFS